LLIGISPEYLYLHEKNPKIISDLHKPYFLVFCPEERNIESARNDLIKKWEINKSSDDMYSKIKEIGKVETYRSFWDFGVKREVFKIFTKKSYFVPDLSDFLFFNQGLYTAEHDIPYQQRALVDIAAEGKEWLFDTKGNKKRLNVLVYDIETSEFEKGKQNIPIDIIGYSDFKISFDSDKNLENEEFSFNILDCPSDWEGIDVKQLISHNIDEEIENLLEFCKTVTINDIISGHNIIGFDNFQIYNRINWILKYKKNQLSDENRKIFQDFVTKKSRPDKSFYFGIRSEAVQFYPCCLDTYLGVRKFYSFLNDFSLKSVAPFLGIEIKDRIILTPSQIKIDDRTIKYNKQDVQEQLGVTLNLIQQSLPLAFTTCMPFDMLLSSGAVNMWDHMSLIRASIQKKIMPPICRVLSISQVLLKYFKGCNTREEIARHSKKIKEQLSKDFVRVVKYGHEMPKWMEDPYVIYNENPTDPDERLNYHMPGGMTIKPDKEAFSHFIPWWHVVVADVGAMYPTILKAMNVGADTVRLARKAERPDDWIWLKKLPNRFLSNRDVYSRKITKEDTYADEGFILGIKIDDKPGVVNCAMTGIMNIIAKTKDELNEAKKSNNKADLQRLKMMYQSVKGARNAGSVDYSQRIVLINSEGEYENIKIGEFVDKAIDKFGYFTEKINGTDFEIANIKDNWRAVSINKNGKIELKKVKQAVRHKWKGKLVKISTKSGFTVVTPNHSVFTIKDKAIKEISAGEINTDTLLVHANKIPNIEKSQKINLINAIKKPGYYGFIEKTDLNHFNGLKKDFLHLNLKENTCTPYLKIKLENLKKIDIPDDLLKYIKVGSNGRKSSRIKSCIKIDEDLAEFLGYYISEGHTSKRIRNKNPFYYITISSASYKMHNRIHKISNKIFGLEPYLLDRRKTHRTIASTVHAKVLNHFLEEIIKCGYNSRNKKIPNQILSASSSVKKSFLKAYMEGDGNYKFDMPNSCPLGRFTTNSRDLNEDLINIQKQFGIKINTYFRESEKTYNTRMVNFYKGKKEELEDCYAIPPIKIEYINSSSDYVYDISVEDNENFIDINGGLLLHNTHGILAAPGVSGRQFNLWGAAAITTKGQAILADTLDYLKDRNIRVVYGDTDGIYMGCSDSVGNIPGFSKSLGLSIDENEEDWITKPNIALSAIEECNSKWQKELDYPDFELEPEIHDGMIFVKHKNYLIFDNKDNKIEMITKGNNFKGSDKADIARKTLKKIMIEVLKENPTWKDEDKARESVKNSIMEKTKDIVSKLDLTQVDLDDLILVQSVQPAKRYKLNQDGSVGVFGKRSQALEKLIGQPIKSRIKLKFVITKRPLPGIIKPSKSGVKPIDYMYPVDFLKDKNEIDLDWYKKMIENYIQGAFGLSDIAVTEQTGLDSWM
jgi:DNA polymerase elongation subunit (family B)